MDFLVQKGFDKPIPVEVSIGKKNRRQVKNAINRYESSPGIIISDTTENIVQNNDIIYLPFRTFSFI